LSLLFTIFEWVATWAECIVVAAVIVAVCGKRKSVLQTTGLVLLFSILDTVLIQTLNAITLFSYITPLISIAFFVLICARFLSNESLLMRCISVFLAYIIIQTIDYIIMVLMGFFANVYNDLLAAFTTPGMLRMYYLVIDKLVDIIVICALRKPLSKIQELSHRLRILTLFICMISYGFMQLLVYSILSSNVATIQSTVIISWFFILCFLGAVLALFISMVRSENHRWTQEMLKTENKMMEENYKHLNKLQTEYAKELHDFKHHLTAILGLSLENKQGQIPEYIQHLLSTSHPHTVVCHSGSDITDAIINCKYAEAKELHIAFSFVANLHDPVSIDPIDICGILANQIDNAFDACKQIDDPKGRMVEVEVKQTQGMVFFLVKNTVAHDPFENNAALQSTKQKGKKRHGLGLENIRSIAEKYNGALQNTYQDGQFISTAFLCFGEDRKAENL